MGWELIEKYLQRKQSTYCAVFSGEKKNKEKKERKQGSLMNGFQHWPSHVFHFQPELFIACLSLPADPRRRNNSSIANWAAARSISRSWDMKKRGEKTETGNNKIRVPLKWGKEGSWMNEYNLFLLFFVPGRARPIKGCFYPVNGTTISLSTLSQGGS